MIYRLYPRWLALEHYLNAGRTFALYLVNDQLRTFEDDERLAIWEGWENEMIRRGYRTRSYEDFKSHTIQRPESIMKRADDEEPIHHAVHFRRQTAFQASPSYGQGS